MTEEEKANLIECTKSSLMPPKLRLKALQVYLLSEAGTLPEEILEQFFILKQMMDKGCET